MADRDGAAGGVCDRTDDRRGRGQARKSPDAKRRVWQDRDRIAEVEYIGDVQVVRLRAKRRFVAGF